jgi:hypothetical protein
MAKSRHRCSSKEQTNGCKRSKTQLRRVPLSEVKDDLSKYLRLAERKRLSLHGMASRLNPDRVRLEDDWFDYRLEMDPRRRLNEREPASESRTKRPFGRRLRLNRADIIGGGVIHVARVVRGSVWRPGGSSCGAAGSGSGPGGADHTAAIGLNFADLVRAARTRGQPAVCSRHGISGLSVLGEGVADLKPDASRRCADLRRSRRKSSPVSRVFPAGRRRSGGGGCVPVVFTVGTRSRKAVRRSRRRHRGCRSRQRATQRSRRGAKSLRSSARKKLGLCREPGGRGGPVRIRGSHRSHV